MLAETVITNWPSAITTLGVVAMVCGVLMVFIKYAFTSPGSHSTTSVADLPPEPAYRYEETKTTTEIDHDAIKSILKEMGYGAAVNQAALDSSIAGVTKAMERDYSSLMQRIDEIRALKEAPYPYAKDDTSTFVPKNQPGDACH